MVLQCLETGFNSCTWYYLGLQPLMHQSLLDVSAGGQGRMMVCSYLGAFVDYLNVLEQ